MHDLSSFRTNLDSIAQRLATRGYQLDVDQFRTLDAERRAALEAALFVEQAILRKVGVTAPR